MAAFGNVYKINAPLLNAWTQILKRVSHAVLWLIDDNEVTTRELKKQIKLRGVSDHQVVFTPRATHSEYQSRIKLADLFLDSFPYNCGSTTRDVLNCGTPIVTCSGRTMVSRMTGSVLNSLHLNELITDNLQAYEDTVVSLAQSPDTLNKLREALKIKTSLNQKNVKKITQSLENALIQKVKQLGTAS